MAESRDHQVLMKLYKSGQVAMIRKYLGYVLKVNDYRDKKVKATDKGVEEVRAANTHLTDEAWQTLLGGDFPAEDCVFTVNTPYKKDSKYTKILIKPDGQDSNANIGCHKLAALLGWKPEAATDPRPTARLTLEPDGKLPLNWAASHFYCHNEACVNPLHLLPETNQVNQERNTCKAHVATVGYFCPHFPTCKDLRPCGGGAAVKVDKDFASPDTDSMEADE